MQARVSSPQQAMANSRAAERPQTEPLHANPAGDRTTEARGSLALDRDHLKGEQAGEHRWNVPEGKEASLGQDLVLGLGWVDAWVGRKEASGSWGARAGWGTPTQIATCLPIPRPDAPGLLLFLMTSVQGRSGIHPLVDAQQGCKIDDMEAPII